MSIPIAEIETTNLGEPAIRRRDVVLVTGPPLAGTTGVVAALRGRLTERTVVEAADLRPGEAPAVVVFVSSASAPLTESDCALLDAATAWTDVVVGAVSKTDAHRTWRAVLQADRAALAGRAARYAGMPWVGVAAAPDIGAPDVDRLVDVLRAVFAEPALERRNRLRAWHSHLLGLRCRPEPDGSGRTERLAELSERRAALLSRRQLDKASQTITLRAQTQQARLQLSSVTRTRCTAVRVELQRDAAATTRRLRAEFVGTVRDRLTALADEVDGAVTARLAAAAADLGLRAVDVPAPPMPRAAVPAPALRSRRLETRLTALLGAGFGLGVALTLSRMLAELAPGPIAAVGCAAVGVALTLWVVGARGLLQDRAVLERWVTDVVTALRGTLEERVAARVLAAESAFGGALAERDVTAAAGVRDQVAALDREIGDHRMAQARAVAVGDRRLPAIGRALVAIGAELGRLRADGSLKPADEPVEAPI